MNIKFLETAHDCLRHCLECSGPESVGVAELVGIPTAPGGSPAEAAEHSSTMQLPSAGHQAGNMQPAAAMSQGTGLPEIPAPLLPAEVRLLGYLGERRTYQAEQIHIAILFIQSRNKQGLLTTCVWLSDTFTQGHAHMLVRPSL